MERRTGVFLSSASPLHETNAVGMHKRRTVGILQNVGGAGHVPNCVATCLTVCRRPPVGKLEPSGSP